jgi:hypothetical protein
LGHWALGHHSSFQFSLDGLTLLVPFFKEKILEHKKKILEHKAIHCEFDQSSQIL